MVLPGGQTGDFNVIRFRNVFQGPLIKNEIRENINQPKVAFKLDFNINQVLKHVF